MQSVGGGAAALPLQRHPGGVVEDADRPDEAVAAAVLAGAGRALAQLVALDPQRIGDLQRLDRGVHRIGHVALDAVVARPHRPAALAAADRLDIAVGPPPRDFGARVVAADRDRVHRALAPRPPPVPPGSGGGPPHPVGGFDARKLPSGIFNSTLRKVPAFTGTSGSVRILIAKNEAE